MSRRSALTRTDQNRLSRALSSLWKLRPGLASFTCRSKAVVFAAFCSSAVSRPRLSVKVSAIRNVIALDLEDLHHLVTQMVDHLDCDPPGLRRVERPGHVAVERLPRFAVDLRLERDLERLVRVVGT